jgi:hypothetical protein
LNQLARHDPCGPEGVRAALIFQKIVAFHQILIYHLPLDALEHGSVPAAAIAPQVPRGHPRLDPSRPVSD